MLTSVRAQACRCARVLCCALTCRFRDAAARATAPAAAPGAAPLATPPRGRRGLCQASARRICRSADLPCTIGRCGVGPPHRPRSVYLIHGRWGVRPCRSSCDDVARGKSSRHGQSTGGLCLSAFDPAEPPEAPLGARPADRSCAAPRAAGAGDGPAGARAVAAHCLAEHVVAPAPAAAVEAHAAARVAAAVVGRRQRRGF